MRREQRMQPEASSSAVADQDHQTMQSEVPGNRAMAHALRTLGATLGESGDPHEHSAHAAAHLARSVALSEYALGGRFHTNRAAAQLAGALNARAVTVGRDTFFGKSQYQPGTPDGRALIAHELTHVVQNRAGATRKIRREQLPITPLGPSPSGGVAVTFDVKAPWMVIVDGHPDPVDVALELYGIELASAVRRIDLLPRQIAHLLPTVGDRYVVVPEMLRQVYADEFHQLMHTALERDVSSVESTLFEARIDGDDEAEMISIVRWWSERKDLVDPNGHSYFDAFLGVLRADSWYRDYGFFEGSSTSYFDTLYTEVEERAGELNTLIAQNSVEFGAYEPLWGTLSGTATGAGPNEELVGRTAELVLDLLEGRTNEDESGTIADALVGLPAREKAAVLRAIMSRYDESEYIIFGRFGEAWEGGMLYWLFEDLEEEDGLRVAESIKASGVMQPEVVDALVAGRGWGGKYLPWTTYHGQQAAQFWADTYNESEGATAFGALIGGGFASLWTPETAGATVLTLVTAGTAPAVATAVPRLSRGLLVVGTGATAYQVTVAGGELISGEDAYTGEKLDRTEKIVRILHVVSGILLLSSGFMSAGASVRAPSAVSDLAVADEAAVQWRITGSDPQTGELIAVGTHVATGETAVIRLNPQTGTGSTTNLATGQVRAIRAFELEAPAAGELPAAGEPAAPPMPSSPTPLLGEGLPPAKTPGAPYVPAPFAGEAEVADMFAAAQATGSAEALVEDALAAGLVPQPVPEVFYYDEVSGDFLPWYLNAETGNITPSRLQAANLGNVVEKMLGFGYPVNQLPLRTRMSGEGSVSGKGQVVRLDSYDPEKGEIVSRKVTQLGRIDEWDALGHLQELYLKYPSGAVVANTPSTRAAGLAGELIEGQLILEVPPQLDPIPERVLEYANERNIVIRDWTGVELN